ncbi:MAG: ATP-binding cassette domain-containing protein [Candidatus Roizmanbacteria bacterium]
MISFRNVTISFGNGVTALSSVSFDIPKNDFVFLVGQSGAGKSTVLNSIMGSHRPKSGTIEVGSSGTKVGRINGKKLSLLRQEIGFVFQDFKIIPYKNVFENVLVALTIKGISPSLYQPEVMSVLHSVGLENRLYEFPSQLSAGEQQRVAIARALAGGRQIILADEPTGNLDPKTTWEIMRIFTNLTGQRTVVIATHNNDVVNSLKKRTITLEQGHLVSDLVSSHTTS